MKLTRSQQKAPGGPRCPKKIMSSLTEETMEFGDKAVRDGIVIFAF